MNGSNELHLCQAAICEAIEYWARQTVFKTDSICVVKVEPKANSMRNSPYEFTVIITDKVNPLLEEVL